MFVYLISIYILLFIIYLYNFSKCRPPNFPPGPARLPFWGSYWFLLWGDYKFPHNTMHRMAKKLKTKIIGFYSGPYPTVVTFNNELCRELLIRPEFQGRMDTFVPRLRSGSIGGKLLGIFFVEGPYWLQQRRFALRHMRDYGFGRRSENLETVVLEEVQYVIDILKNGIQLQDDKDISPQKGHALMPDILYAGWTNAIWHVLAGDRFPKTNYKKLRDIARAALAFQRASDPLGGALTFTPWLRYIGPKFFGYTPVVESNNVLLNFMKEAILEHKNSFTEDMRRDFIDMYLNEMEKIDKNEYSSFSEEQLILTTVDFLFPSQTATTVMIGFLFIHLLLNPDVQTKIHEEIDCIVGRDRFPTLDDRPMMPYTEATIREVMRIDPLNPLGVPRKCIEDTHLGGYFIPKGTMLLPCLYSNNMDPNLWVDPENFRPDRWLDTQGKLKKKDFTMPFGAGKRLCAGETFARQNMFLFVAGLLQNFTFKVPNGSPLPDVKTHIPGFNVSPKEYIIQAVPRD